MLGQSIKRIEAQMQLTAKQVRNTSYEVTDLLSALSRLVLKQGFLVDHACGWLMNTSGLTPAFKSISAV